MTVAEVLAIIRLVPREKWKIAWEYITLHAHPIMVGMLLGVIVTTGGFFSIFNGQFKSQGRNGQLVSRFNLGIGKEKVVVVNKLIVRFDHQTWYEYDGDTIRTYPSVSMSGHAVSRGYETHNNFKLHEPLIIPIDSMTYALLIVNLDENEDDTVATFEFRRLY